MRYELKSISIWSFVKISFFLNLVLGFIIGFFYAAFMGLFLSIAGNSGLAGEWGLDPDEMSIGVLFIMFPIVFGVMGAIFQTLLMTLIVGMYNLITKMTGGLVLNLTQLDPSPVPNIPVAATARASAPVASAQVAAPLPPPAAPQAVKVKPAQPSDPAVSSPQPEPVQPKPTEPDQTSDQNRPDAENKQDNSPAG